MTGPTTRPASGRDRARTARPGGWLRRQRPRSALVLAAVLLLGSGGSLVLDGRPVAAVDANGYEATLLPLGSYTSGSVVDVRGSLAVGTVYGQDCQGGCAAWWDLSLAEPAGPTVLPLGGDSSSGSVATDGRWVVGTRWSAGGARAFAVDTSTGMTNGANWSTGTTNASAADVDEGVLVGQATLSGNKLRAFAATLPDPTLRDLGIVGQPGSTSAAAGLSASIVAATAYTGNSQESTAFVFDLRRSSPIALGGLGGKRTVATAIDGAIVAGWSTSSANDVPTRHAFYVDLPRGTGAIDLGTLPGGAYSEAVAVDGLVIVGFSSATSGERAFAVDLGQIPRTMRDLGTTDGFGSSRARAVSGHLVVGSQTAAGGAERAFAFDLEATAGMVALPLPEGSGTSRALAVDGTTIVGWAAATGGAPQPVIWRPTSDDGGGGGGGGGGDGDPGEALVVEPAASEFTAGTRLSLAAYLGGNGGSPVQASYAIAPDGSCDASSCTATTSGTHEITATFATDTTTYTDSVLVEVRNDAASHLAITAGPSGDRSADTTFDVAVTLYDRYENVAVDSEALVTIHVDAFCQANPCNGDSTTATAGVALFPERAVRTAGGPYRYVAASQGLGETTGSAFTITPGALASLSLDGIADLTAGATISVTVRAADAWGNAKTDYPAGSGPTLEGTAFVASPACLACEPPIASVSATSGTVAWSGGIGTFTGVRLFRASTAATISITDGSIGDATTFTVRPAALAAFVTDDLADQTAGVATSVSATPYDAYGNVKTDYGIGSARLVGSALDRSPGCASCSPALAARDGSAGTAEWLAGSSTIRFPAAVFYRAGSATVAISDGTVSDATTFTIRPGTELRGLTISDTDGTRSRESLTTGDRTAGIAFDLRVTAYDAYGNVNSGYAGGATLSGLRASPGCTGCAPDLPAEAPDYGSPGWSGGIGVYAGVVAYEATSGVRLTVLDAASAVSNTTGTFTVRPATLSGLTLTSRTDGTVATARSATDRAAGTGNAVRDQTAGIAVTVTVTAFDRYGNLKTDYAGGARLDGSAFGSSPGCSPCGRSASSGDRSSGTWSGGTGRYRVTFYDASPNASLSVSDGSVANAANDGGGFTISPNSLFRILFANASVGFTDGTGIGWGDGQPIDGKKGQPIYRACVPSIPDATGYTAAPCATVEEIARNGYYPIAYGWDDVWSPAIKVIAIDSWGNRVAGVPVTLSAVLAGTTTAAPLAIGSPTRTTFGDGPPEEGPYGEAAFSDGTIVVPGFYQLKATSGAATPAYSTSFRVVDDLQACDGTACTNIAQGDATSSTSINAVTLVTTPNDMYQTTSTMSLVAALPAVYAGAAATPYRNVLLSTSFNKWKKGDKVVSYCGSFSSIGDELDVRLYGAGVGFVMGDPSAASIVVDVLPKNTLKASGILSRGISLFEICLGAIYLGEPTSGTAWYGKKIGKTVTAKSVRATDADGTVRYWGVPADCPIGILKDPMLQAKQQDPCIALRTKLRSELVMAVGETVATQTKFSDSDVAVIIFKPKQWDGKAKYF